MLNLKTILGLECFIESSDRFLGLDLKVSVDNRELSEDHIFVAIVGQRYNPLEHLDKVYESGCRFLVYENNESNDQLAAKYKEKLVLIKVKNIEDFIQQAGRAVANTFRCRGGKIIAISGSNGKTTTKEMLTHILKSALGDNAIICTQKNNNNHLGVPFTLFQIEKESMFAIVELGSNHPGEIEHLCQMIQPNLGVTTNIGETHLEFFHNLDNVFKEESTLKDYVSELFFVNKDDDYLKALDLLNAVEFGQEAKDFKFEFNAGVAKLNNLIVENEFIFGEHNFRNLMLSIAIAHKLLGEKIGQLIKYASEFKPTFNRSQIIDTGKQKVFLDAYNANPTSMKIAIDEFLKHCASIGAAPEDICLVIGDMNELGEQSTQLHQDLAKYIDHSKVSHVLFIGRYSDAYGSCYKGAHTCFSDVSKDKDEVKQLIAKYKFVFIKGSRSLQLEAILDIR